MAVKYRPSEPFSVPLVILKPEYQKIFGVPKKDIPNIQAAIDSGNLIYGSFKTYGGTDRTVDGLYSVIDTADIETWYRPDIKSNCIIALAETGECYEILGEPENINRRNQYLKMKVQRVKGGA